MRDNVHAESRLQTDESKLYINVGREFTAHETVNHSAKEYARGDVTTNTVEGYFSIFKRGMRGNYQHCAEKNLDRYLAEFDFRYNTRTITDGERAVLAVQVAKASASRIVNLVKADFFFAAARFMRWRKKLPKPKKPKAPFVLIAKRWTET